MIKDMWRMVWGEVVTHHLDRGLMISGWSQMNVGLMQLTSMKSPTSYTKHSQKMNIKQRLRRERGREGRRRKRERETETKEEGREGGGKDENKEEGIEGKRRVGEREEGRQKEIWKGPSRRKLGKHYIDTYKPCSAWTIITMTGHHID